MRTLILNGSPRPEGDTARLLALLTAELKGDFLRADVYRNGIGPCLDCRYCRTHPGCAIRDGMQEIYDYLPDCDNVLIASPIYFSELTGRLLEVGSRLQTFFCGRYFRGEEPLPKAKRGAVLLVGGGDGNMAKAYDTARTLLRHMRCTEIHELVESHNTNRVPALQDPAAIEGIRKILAFFNEERRGG